MLTELVKHLGEQAVKANAIHIQMIPGTHQAVIDLRDRVEFIDLPAADRGHVVYDLDSLIAAVKAFAGASASIWHGDHNVIALLDDGTRRDTVTLHLEQSAHMRCLTAVPEYTLPQREFIRLLQVELNGAAPETLIASLRRVTFKRGATTSGTVAHGEESLGQKIEAQVSTADQIPEFVTLMARIYANLPAREPIPCHLGVDSRNEVFTLTPLPDAINDAIATVNANLHAELVAAFSPPPAQAEPSDDPAQYVSPKVEIFHGTP